ncbi:hypothetical protein L7F22_060784 [Adiantum nelumboides]|nr:hypothetical protein [Adiantum nelumboides]
MLPAQVVPASGLAWAGRFVFNWPRYVSNMACVDFQAVNGDSTVLQLAVDLACTVGGARVPWPVVNPQWYLLNYCTAASTCSHSRKLDVQVGATLQVNLAHVNADVDVYTGDNMEQVEVKSLWKKVGSFSAAFTPITQQNNCICVDLQTTEAKQFLQTFEAIIPGRWCNLLLRTGKGHVTVQNMKEANVKVVTNGGNVTLGEVQGNEASIESNGGNVRAALITAALKLQTSGGYLSLDKAVGTTLQVVSEGGDIKLGSAYGQGKQLYYHIFVMYEK